MHMPLRKLDVHMPGMDGLQVARQLADRRTGLADNGEPYGLLTHHLVHDAAIWDFTEKLLDHLRAGPVRLWSACQDLPS